MLLSKQANVLATSVFHSFPEVLRHWDIRRAGTLLENLKLRVHEFRLSYKHTLQERVEQLPRKKELGSVCPEDEIGDLSRGPTRSVTAALLSSLGAASPQTLLIKPTVKALLVTPLPRFFRRPPTTLHGNSRRRDGARHRNHDEGGNRESHLRVRNKVTWWRCYHQTRYPFLPGTRGTTRLVGAMVAVIGRRRRAVPLRFALAASTFHSFNTNLFVEPIFPPCASE